MKELIAIAVVLSVVTVIAIVELAKALNEELNSIIEEDDNGNARDN